MNIEESVSCGGGALCALQTMKIERRVPSFGDGFHWRRNWIPRRTAKKCNVTFKEKQIRRFDGSANCVPGIRGVSEEKSLKKRFIHVLQMLNHHRTLLSVVQVFGAVCTGPITLLPLFIAAFRLFHFRGVFWGQDFKSTWRRVVTTFDHRMKHLDGKSVENSQGHYRVNLPVFASSSQREPIRPSSVVLDMWCR